MLMEIFAFCAEMLGGLIFSPIYCLYLKGALKMETVWLYETLISTRKPTQRHKSKIMSEIFFALITPDPTLLKY